MSQSHARGRRTLAVTLSGNLNFIAASAVSISPLRTSSSSIQGTEGLVTDTDVAALPVVIAPPQLRVPKTSEVLSDPFNGSVNARRISGAIVRYSVTLSNTGPGTVDADSLAITDILPADTELLVIGAPWSDVPLPRPGGFDPALRGQRITPSGAMSASSGGGARSFTVRFRVRVR
jgi:uncharacterized repeat protein (TIGR01451 family)